MTAAIDSCEIVRAFGPRPVGSADTQKSSKPICDSSNNSYQSKSRRKPMETILPMNGGTVTGRPVRAWRLLVVLVSVFVLGAVVSTAAIAQVTDCTLLTFSEQL